MTIFGTKSHNVNETVFTFPTKDHVNFGIEVLTDLCYFNVIKLEFDLKSNGKIKIYKLESLATVFHILEVSKLN